MNAKLKVCMFVYNSFRPDVRPLKEAKTLNRHGFDVTVMALLDNNSIPFQVYDGVRVYRINRNPVHMRLLQWLKNFGNVDDGPKLPPFPKRDGKSGSNSIDQLKWATRLAKKLTITLIYFAIFYTLIDFLFSDSASFFYSTYKPYILMIILLLIANRNTIRRYKGKISRKPLKPIILNTTRRILNPLHSHLSYFDYYKRCYDALKSAPADIYHAHDLNTLIIAWWCKRKLGGKLVYDSHELFTEQGLLTKSNRIVWAKIEKTLIKKCDKVITVCDSIAAELRDRYSIAQPTVIRNCPESNGSATGTHDFIRAATGIDANTPVILYQGGFSKNRGLKSLILSTRYFDRGKLVMMGWGNVEEELKAFTRSKGLAKKVCFIPPVPQSELLSWSSSADLGVIPYRAVGLNNYYSCPNKLFEYINAGLPVAGSDFPELSKIIGGWKIGRTFDPEDPQSIGKTINGILADKHLLKEMRVNSVHASKTLNWQCESENLLGVYSEFKKQKVPI